MAVLIGPASPSQGLPRASELTHKILKLRNETSFRGRGRLVYTDANKHQTVFQISVLQKPLAQSTNMLWSVTDPPESRMRILIAAQPDGRTTVWRSSGGKGGAPILPVRRWADPILGSQLTVEDLMEDYFTWPRQVVVGEELLGGKMCYVVRSEPDAQPPSTYSTVTSWVDETTLIAMRILKHSPGVGPQKEILRSGVRRSGGRWVASIIELRIPGSPGSTRIVFTAGSENARIADSEVDPKLLFGSGASER